jgi:hypothetical protein
MTPAPGLGSYLSIIMSAVFYLDSSLLQGACGALLVCPPFPRGVNDTSKLVLYTERSVLDCVYGILSVYVFFVGRCLCFFRLFIFASSGPRPLCIWGHFYALFVCYCLRAAARARYTFGAFAIFFLH